MITPTIVSEDNQIIVVIKPHNIAVQEDSSHDPDMLTIIKQFIKDRDNKPSNVYLGLVHRLDRPTGGLMVFAKTSKSASRLSKQVREKEFKKSYLCVVNGIPNKPSGRLTTYLKKDSANNIVKIVPKLENGAREAILDYQVIASKQNMALIKINLITGRSHQIRVQMSSQLSTPIVGDFKYGAPTHTGKLALWAYKLEFVHPVTKKRMKFVAEPDFDNSAFANFKEKIEALLNEENF